MSISKQCEIKKNIVRRFARRNPGPPNAPLGAGNLDIRLELQSLPEPVGGKTDQNKSADDRQSTKLGRCSSPVGSRPAGLFANAVSVMTGLPSLAFSCY